jgi:hypothetical protein
MGVESLDIAEPVGELERQYPRWSLGQVSEVGLPRRRAVLAHGLRDPVDQFADVGPEALLDFFGGGRGVLHDIVQQGGRQQVEFGFVALVITPCDR